MHPAALHWAKQHVPEIPRRVIEIGGMDVNCSLRFLFTWSWYTCVDIAPGPGVDVVMDFPTWAYQNPTEMCDFVASFEVLEHAANWREIVAGAHHLLEPGGHFVGTCATDGRTPHSAYGFPELPPDEYYHNVNASDLVDALVTAGFRTFTVDVARSYQDLRWDATR